MPNTYKLYAANNLGTTPVVLRTIPAATTGIVLSLTMANLTGATVKGRAYVTRSAVDYDVHPLVDIPAGGAFVSIGESQKLVLEVGDAITVVGDTATSLDVLCSILEIS